MFFYLLSTLIKSEMAGAKTMQGKAAHIQMPHSMNENYYPLNTILTTPAPKCRNLRLRMQKRKLLHQQV
jgi:hypothetical protein